MKAEGDDFVGETSAPAAGGAAVFGECEYAVDGRTFNLSVPATVLGRRSA